MSPGVVRNEPPYVQVFKHYQTKILNGHFQHGDRLPSVRAMASEWSISSATAGKVLGALQSEGLAEARPGVGTMVSTRTIAPSGADRARRRRATGSLYLPGERSEIVESEVVKASGEIAAALCLRDGDPVIKRRRIVYQNDVPMEVSTSYLPGAFKDHAPALLKTQKLPVQGGTAGYIEKMLGKRITAGRDQTCSRLATEDEIQDLQLEQGASVLGGRNTWFTDADEPVEYGISAVVQGRWRTDEYSLS